MARRRRHYGSYLTVPGLGDLKTLVKDVNPLGQSVRMNDLLLGAGVGMAGGAAVKMGLNSLIGRASAGNKVAEIVSTYIGPISTIGAGVAGYMFFKKKNAAKAKGVLYGAMLAGLVPTGWAFLQRQFPQYFSDYLTVPGLGEVVSQPMGLLVEEGSPALNALGAIHDSDEAF